MNHLFSKNHFLVVIFLFAAVLISTTSCNKDEDAPETVVGTYDLISYSLINCEDVDLIINTEENECSILDGVSFCLSGTMIFTETTLTIDLNLTVDGEADGFTTTSNYTIEGDKLVSCLTPDDCETSDFKFENGKVEFSGKDGDCISSLVGKNDSGTGVRNEKQINAKF